MLIKLELFALKVFLDTLSIDLLPEQFLPSATKPLRHWQLYDPGVLVQFALVSQSMVDSLEHSSISGNKK
jgi:hypothetical protein